MSSSAVCWAFISWLDSCWMTFSRSLWSSSSLCKPSSSFRWACQRVAGGNKVKTVQYCAVLPQEWPREQAKSTEIPSKCNQHQNIPTTAKQTKQSKPHTKENKANKTTQRRQTKANQTNQNRTKKAKQHKESRPNQNKPTKANKENKPNKPNNLSHKPKKTKQTKQRKEGRPKQTWISIGQKYSPISWMEGWLCKRNSCIQKLAYSIYPYCHTLACSTPKHGQPSILSHYPIQVLVLVGCLLRISQLGRFLLDDVQSLIMVFNQLLQAVKLFLMSLQRLRNTIGLAIIRLLGSKKPSKEGLKKLVHILQRYKQVEDMNIRAVLIMMQSTRTSARSVSQKKKSFPVWSAGWVAVSSVAEKNTS